MLSNLFSLTIRYENLEEEEEEEEEEDINIDPTLNIGHLYFEVLVQLKSLLPPSIDNIENP